MARTKDRQVGAVRGGLAAAAKALGGAVGFFGRIRIPRRRGCAAPAEKKPFWSRRARSSDRRELEDEIERLEAEIDQVYARVVRGAGSVGRDDLSGTDLSDLLAVSRELKEQLRAKRAELSRIERDKTREQRLVRTARPASSSKLLGEPEVSRDDMEESGRKDQPLSDKLRRKITRAQRHVVFEDQSQQIIFEKVIQDLLEDDFEIRRTAATRLGELEADQVSVVLTVVLEDPDDKVKAAALNSLALLGESSAAGQFERFISAADHHLRLASLRGLSRIGGIESEDALINALEDDHPAVRKAAATYLGWRESRSATKSLISALHDEEREVRVAAAGSLGAIRDDRAVLSLIRLLLDPEASVREAAHASLHGLLGSDLKVDIQAERKELESHVQELKEWWKQARIEKHIEFEGGPSLPADSRPAMPAMEISARPAKEPEAKTEPEEEPSKVVKLRSPAPARSRKDKPKKEEKSEPEKKAEPEEKPEPEKKPEPVKEEPEDEAAGLDDAQDMGELAGLGAVKASEEPESPEEKESIEDVLSGVESDGEFEGEEEDDGEYESLLDGDLGVRTVESGEEVEKK